MLDKPAKLPMWCISVWAYSKKPKDWSKEEKLHRREKRFGIPKAAHRATRRYNVWKLRTDRWQRVVTRAVAEGRVDPMDAKHRGWDAKVMADTWTGGAEGWAPLPETLYHVTTAKSAILKGGLRSRRLLKMDKGLGLGGGRGEAISFTSNAKIAKDIYRSIHEVVALGRGKLTPTQMVRMAEKGIGAKRPWDALDAMRGEWHLWDRKPGDPVPPHVKVLESGIDVRYVSDYNEKIPLKELAERECVRILSTDEHSLLCEPKVPDRKMWSSQMIHFYNTWAMRRHSAGGPVDTYTVDVDLDKVAKIPPKEIALLTYRGCGEAKGNYVGTTLKEWEIHGRRTVQLTHVNGKKVDQGGGPRCATSTTKRYTGCPTRPSSWGYEIEAET